MIVTDGYRDGDIVLVRARWWLRPFAKYDHVGLLWLRKGELYPFTIESGTSGVRAWCGLEHWRRGYDVYRPKDVDLQQGMDAANAALYMLGTDYAWEHLPAVLWRIIRRPLLAHAVVCTELVTWAWSQAGVELCPGVRSPSPDDIYRSVCGTETDTVDIDALLDKDLSDAFTAVARRTAEREFPK